MEAVCTDQEGVRMSMVSRRAVEPADNWVRYKTPDQRLASYQAVERVLTRHGVYTGVRDEKGYE